MLSIMGKGLEQMLLDRTLGVNIDEQLGRDNTFHSDYQYGFVKG